MTKIRKITQSLIKGLIFNNKNDSKEDTYSCAYINNLASESSGDSVPKGSIIDYDGVEVPDGYEKVDSYDTIPVTLSEYVSSGVINCYKYGNTCFVVLKDIGLTKDLTRYESGINWMTIVIATGLPAPTLEWQVFRTIVPGEGGQNIEPYIQLNNDGTLTLTMRGNDKTFPTGKIFTTSFCYLTD